MSNTNLISQAYDSNLQCWINTSMHALTIFKYATTFDQEVSSVWKRKPSGATLLLLLVRYTMIFVALSGIASLGKVNLQGCTGLLAINSILSLLAFILTAAFSALRVYALCSRSIKLSTTIFILQISPIIMNVYIYIKSVVVIDPLYGCGRELEYSLKTQQALIYASRIPLAMGDALAVVVTWMKSFPQMRVQHSTSVRCSLSALLFRDGTSYFILLLVLNVLLVSPPITAEGAIVLGGLTNSLPLILVNRFMLNLRQLSDSEARSAGCIRTISTPIFQATVDVSGNMGETLEYGWEAQDVEHHDVEEALPDDEERYEDELWTEEVSHGANKARPLEHQAA